MNIKNVVVIGSGTMGSGIAAQLCNANIPVTLLDLKTEISVFKSRSVTGMLALHNCAAIPLPIVPEPMTTTFFIFIEPDTI